jgi:acylglycerol lipase
MKDPVALKKFCATDGFNLTYRCWEATKSVKRVVVCIHWIGDYSGWFRNIAPELAAQGSQVYALDLRGFGNSQEEGSPRGYVRDFERHLLDINDFIVNLRGKHKGKKLFVLGHSLGGVYALWYAANFSDSVDGLMLAAPAVDSALNKRKNSALLLFYNALMPRKNYNPFTSSEKNRDPEEIKIMIEDPLETWQLTVNYLSGVKNVLLKDVLRTCSLLESPVLILQGGADTTILPTGAKQLYETLNAKDKKLELFPDAGHWFYDALCPVSPRAKHNQEKRNQFIAVVNDWLNKHS